MFNKIILNNGVRLVYEKTPHVRSVTVGIWVENGSRREDLSNNGISHFLEHMLFKGTPSRTSKEIADCIDSIGGQINAFTGKECTCYYTKTLDTHLNLAVDVLTDMFFNSNLFQKEIDVEKKVVLEEIKMYEDSPEELVMDLITDTIYKGDSLGYSILGNSEVLKKLTTNDLKNFMNKNYVPHGTVIAVSGNFDENELKVLIENKFGNWKSEEKSKIIYPKVPFNQGVAVKEKDTEQVHLCLAFPGIEVGNDDMYSLLAVSTMFGGGMSSRLFQRIREEKGLVYSIYSYPSAHKNAGSFTIYAGMNPDHLEEVISLVKSEINILKKDYLNDQEINKAKEQFKGGYILGLESSSSRMNSIGKSELTLGKILTFDQVIEKIDSIDKKTVIKVIDQVFDTNKFAIAAVGNIKDKKVLNF